MRVHVSFEFQKADLEAMAFWGGHLGMAKRDTVKNFVRWAVDEELSEMVSKLFGDRQAPAPQSAGAGSSVYYEDGKAILVTGPLGAETMDEQRGVFNASADAAERRNTTWSDTNLTEVFPPGTRFDRLMCRNCHGIHFEVLGTGSYETTARCVACGMYYIVHNG